MPLMREFVYARWDVLVEEWTTNLVESAPSTIELLAF